MNYNTILKFPKKTYQIGDELTHHNNLKVKLKFQESDKVIGLTSIPPDKTAKFIKTSKGWEGTII